MKNYRELLVQDFARSLLAGHYYASIVIARSQAEDVLGFSIHPGDAWVKIVDETMEAAMGKNLYDGISYGRSHPMPFWFWMKPMKQGAAKVDGPIRMNPLIEPRLYGS